MRLIFFPIWVLIFCMFSYVKLFFACFKDIFKLRWYLHTVKYTDPKCIFQPVKNAYTCLIASLWSYKTCLSSPKFLCASFQSLTAPRSNHCSGFFHESLSYPGTSHERNYTMYNSFVTSFFSSGECFWGVPMWFCLSFIPFYCWTFNCV